MLYSIKDVTEAISLNEQKNKNEVVWSLVAGLLAGLFTIFMYSIAFLILNFLIGSKGYVFTILMLAVFSISSGVYFVFYGKGSLKKWTGYMSFILTLIAGSILINKFEIFLFSAIPIMSIAVMKIILWGIWHRYAKKET